MVYSMQFDLGTRTSELMGHLKKSLVVMAALVVMTQSQSRPAMIRCGVSTSYDCSSVSLSTTTVLYFYGSSMSTYPLTAAGANALTSNPNFSISKMTVIFVHGFSRSPDAPGPLAIKDAFILKSDTVNYLAVNATDIFAGSLSNFFSYRGVAPRSVCLGVGLAGFLVALNGLGVSENNLYVIGHSLGAPTVSFAAKQFTATTGRKLFRLTALDSAGLCFDPDTSIQPQPGDAQHVDAIHTNEYGYGSVTKLGNADFYPNGGLIQPYCLLPANLLDPTCSHAQALFYYAESVNTNTCIGLETLTLLGIPLMPSSSQTVIMGYNWQFESGNFYVSMNMNPPYCRGTAAKNATSEELRKQLYHKNKLKTFKKMHLFSKKYII